MRYFRKVPGNRVYLSPINEEDYPVYTRWINDKAVSLHLGSHGMVFGLSAEKKALETLAGEGHTFAIVRAEDDVLLGNIGLMNVSNIHRHAEVGMFIGEAGSRGVGYGTEALQLMLDYAFNTLNFHNIMLRVHADNDRAIRCYTRAGFREIGRRRQCDFKEGRYVDDVFMDMLRDEFNSRSQNNTLFK